MINSVSSVFCKLIRFLPKSFQSLLHCAQLLAVLLPVQLLHTISCKLSVHFIVRPTVRPTTFYPLALSAEPNPACALR